MRMFPREIYALRDYLGPVPRGRTLSDVRHKVSLTRFVQSWLAGRLAREMSGRSVLVVTSGNFWPRSR